MLLKYYLKRLYLLLPYFIVIVLAPQIQVESSMYSAQMMDAATAGQYSTFLKYFGVLIVLFLIHGLLLFLTQSIRTSMVRHGRESIKKDMFSSIMASGNSTFSKPDAGNYIASFSNDISILEYKYFEPVLELIESIIAIVTASVAITALSRELASLIVIGEVISVVICALFRKYLSKKNRYYIDKLTTFTQRIKDYFSSFQTIRNYSVEKKIKKKFDEINTQTEQYKCEADTSICFVDTLAKVCNSIIKFFVVGYGAVLIMKGDMTVGLVYAAYRFCDQIISPVHSMISKINMIESVKSIVVRISDLSKGVSKETAVDNISFDNSGISIQNLSYSINEQTILDSISYKFERGKKYLIIGKNGAGKSTLLRFLKKSQDDYSGTITVGGQDLRNISYSLLSEKVSYINESVSLLCDSVKQNILLYRDADESALDDIVKTVGLSVPLERVIRDGERNLSSGETRRIEIARSLISRAEVIIYDEAISTLDIQTAYSIEKMLLSLEDQTIIFVSHNFSSLLIDKYDAIILMENGKIIDSGKHTELLHRNKSYQHIMGIKSGEEYGA